MSTGQQVSLQVNGGQKITKKGLNLIIHHSTHLWHTCSGNYELFYILDFLPFLPLVTSHMKIMAIIYVYMQTIGSLSAF